jgi:membrane-anchored glycerophosphoryl diester phosphodiesterase (GDPDase)
MEQSPSAAPSSAMPGLGSIFSAATNSTLSNAGVLLGLWAFCAMPAQLLGFVVGLITGLSDENAVRDAITAQNWPALGMLGVVAVISMALGLIGYGAVILLASRSMQGETSTAGDLFGESLGRMGTVLLASLLIGFAMGFGLILFIIPGLYLFVRLGLSVCATLVEDLGAADGIRRSWDLVGKNFGETMVFMLVLIAAALCAMIPVVIVNVILRAGASAAGAGAAGALATALIFNALQFMVTAWAAGSMTKYFLELSARSPRDAGTA